MEARFANPRMGLAAHLEGVMNGSFLALLGVVWAEVRLTAPWNRLAYGCALYGCYANWAVTTLAAAFGTGALSPITAPGRQALPWQEDLVTVGFISVGITIIAAVVLLLWGLSRPRGEAGV